MADTLTINTEETTAELTPEEQENLKIGEELAQEESKKLAGKYESAEELEKAYIELQKKLGDDSQEEESEVTEEPEETPDESPAMSLINSANEEFFNNDNSLLIANSDQYVDWDSVEFMYKMKESTCDGGILTFNSEHPNW